MAGDKRINSTDAAVVGGDSLLESLPESLLNEIYLKLEPDTLATLFSIASVSQTLNSSAYKHLADITSLDLSEFSLDAATFDGIKTRFGAINKLTLNCLRLDECSVRSILGPHVEELSLLKCSSLHYDLFARIGTTCPNLRVLNLEFSSYTNPGPFMLYVHRSLRDCHYLESLIIKVRQKDREDSEYDYMFFDHMATYYPHQPIKFLKLESTQASKATVFFKKLAPTDTQLHISHKILVQTLTHLSLVLDITTDALVCAIAQGLPLLTELDLKDTPESKSFDDDLSNLGFQSLAGCKHLKCLSLIRSGQRIFTSYKRTTDMGMFLLAEGCKGLESVRLGGFCKVSDAGYSAILNSCLNLKKFEIRNASLLTDLTFQDVRKIRRSLVEVKLMSCSSITSDAVRELATCNSVEVLDLHGCKSVTDSCLRNVSSLAFLTYLNLGGTNVTDFGMAVLGKSGAHLSCLCLRGCKRVTDNGISFLLSSEGTFSKSLSSIDLSHMPGITDNAITVVAEVCVGLTELCMRNCFGVTDASMKALALKGRSQGENSKFLRRLDVYNCSGLSKASSEYLKKPLFPGLNWIGIGNTRLVGVGDDGLGDIYKERRWITICGEGCEVGCHDGWQFHKF